MRGVFQLKKGPKLSMIRKLITPATDFLILTEIRADQRAIMNTKLRFDLQPSHFSTNQHPRGGVLICAKKYHKKIPGMVQERNHITIVKDRHDPYQCPKKSRIWTADLQGGKVYIIALTYLYFYSIHQSWLVTCIYGCSLSSLLQKWAHQVLLIFLFPEKSFRKYIILSIF